MLTRTGYRLCDSLLEQLFNQVLPLLEIHSEPLLYSSNDPAVIMFVKLPVSCLQSL